MSRTANMRYVCYVYTHDNLPSFVREQRSRSQGFLEDLYLAHAVLLFARWKVTGISCKNVDLNE